jgi:Rrf2 family transcriptional regulator, iron-sulfur cluster assembly transcription factor
MRLTTKGRYGVRAVLNLAASYANRPISIKTIAAEEGISPEFLEQIFFKLKKSGIISSVRGPGGGFVLNRKPSEVTVKDILDAVGEPTFPVPCTDPHDPDRCPRKDICRTTATWQKFGHVINEFLSGLTLKDILDDGGGKLSQGVKQGQDFAI